jgi:hypothetical protein
LETAVSYVAFHYVVFSKHAESITKTIETVLTKSDPKENKAADNLEK